MLDGLSGVRVLVTGGAGFVGSALVRQLLMGGAQVVVLDNFFSGPRENLAEVENDITMIEGDVLVEDTLDRAFRAHAPQRVYHLVGDTFVPSAYRHPGRFVRINTESTLRVLLAAKEYTIERMLYVSSTEVYGQVGDRPISETQPLAPVNTYAVTKAAADRLCYTFHLEHAVPVVVARIFNCYGPRETQPYVVPEIIRQLERGPQVRLGNVNAARDFTYVDDTAAGLIALMHSSLPNGEAVNIGSGRVVPLTSVVALCAELMGRKHPAIECDAQRVRRFDIDSFCCDPTLMRRVTDWTPQVDFEEGLRRTITWYRENGSTWAWEAWCRNGLV